MDAEIFVGNNQFGVGDGTRDTARGGKTGEIIVGDAHAHFYESVSRGNVYTASSMAVTIASTMLANMAAGGTPFLALFNPATSKYNLVIMRVVVTTTSGTPAGPFNLGVIAAPSGITAAGTQGINNLTFTAGGQAKVFANAAMTGSAAASVLRPLGGPAAVAAGAGVYTVDEQMDGEIVVAPGGTIIIGATGAGTTHVASAGIVWEEVKIT